jgi:hypothetical protein
VSHLGERVTALVDGQLPMDATERALAHLAGCRPCRDLVEAERRTKAQLSLLDGPEPSVDLMSRLLAMGGPSGPLPPRPGHVPGSPRPQPVPMRRASVPARVTVGVGDPVPLPPPAPSRVAIVTRPGVYRGPVGPEPSRPAGRPAARAVRSRLERPRVRLAGAVLGALGVVGAGVGGLVMTAPQLPGPAGSGTAEAVVTQPSAITDQLPVTSVRFLLRPGASPEPTIRPDGR